MEVRGPDMITLLGVKWRNHGGDASEPTPIIGRNVGTEEGRVTTWHFPDQVVVTVDAPFSGGGEEHLLQRRAVFNTLKRGDLGQPVRRTGKASGRWPKIWDWGMRRPTERGPSNSIVYKGQAKTATMGCAGTMPSLRTLFLNLGE